MKPSFDWPSLVEQARAGNVDGLVAATRHLSAWHRAYKWPMVASDYPPELLAFLVDDAAPSGKPGRKARSKFRTADAKLSFDAFRTSVKAFKAGGAVLRLIDKRGKEIQPDPHRDSGWKASPADVVLEYLAHQNNISPSAMRDVVYPRKVKSTTKTD